MSEPEGYSQGKGLVCRLKRSLYGLKQSPRQWNRKFTSFLTSHGFKESDADPCVFISRTGGETVYLCVYVDDGILMSVDKKRINQVMNDLETKFKVTKG